MNNLTIFRCCTLTCSFHPTNLFGKTKPLFFLLLFSPAGYSKSTSSMSPFFIFHDLFFTRHDSLPLEITFWEWKAHRPAVTVICIIVSYIISWLAGVVAFNLRVVCLCIALAHHRDAASHSSLDEKVHVKVCQKLKLHICLFKKSIQGQTRRSVVMRRIYSP